VRFSRTRLSDCQEEIVHFEKGNDFDGIGFGPFFERTSPVGLTGGGRWKKEAKDNKKGEEGGKDRGKREDGRWKQKTTRDLAGSGQRLLARISRMDTVKAFQFSRNRVLDFYQ